MQVAVAHETDSRGLLGQLKLNGQLFSEVEAILIPNVYDMISSLYEAIPNVYDMIPELYAAIPSVYDTIPSLYEAIPDVYETIPNSYEAIPNV